MSPPSTDRRLRKLVAELASVSADDRRAVLSGLQERHREQVEVLLAEYRGDGGPGVPAAVATTPGGADRVALEGLSPWLLDRLARAGLNVATPAERQKIWSAHDLGFTMTPVAISALRGAALGLRPSAGPATPPPSRWFSRLLAKIGGGS